MSSRRYQDGTYEAANPTWHAEDSPWKAGRIVEMLRRNDLLPKFVCEVGCGVGGILWELQKALEPDVVFEGWDVSPHALEIARRYESERLTFYLGDFLESDRHYDLILLIDLIEHIEDCFTFMRRIKDRSSAKILHIPLALSASAVLRGGPLVHAWKEVGHIHVFNRELVECFLADVDFEVLDWFYTWGGLAHPRRGLSKLAWLPRAVLSRTLPDWTTRAIGGASMMVLVR